MPTEDCIGTDDDENVGPVCPNQREPRPEDPVCALEPEPFGPGTAENQELLAEGKVLQSQVLAGAYQRAQGPEDGDEHGEHAGFCPDSAAYCRGSCAHKRAGRDSGEAQAWDEAGEP